MAEVWGKDVFVDFEHGLNFCIRQIRNALGDEADHPRFIETVPRRGYRFIAPLEKKSNALVSTGSPAPAKLKLAVLPFTNMGNDPEQEYFSDGLTEELIVELSRLNPNRIGVIARMSVMKYRDTTPTVDLVLKEMCIRDSNKEVYTVPSFSVKTSSLTCSMRRAIPNPCNGPSAWSVFRIIRSSVPCNTSDLLVFTVAPLAIARKIARLLCNVHMRCPIG